MDMKPVRSATLLAAVALSLGLSVNNANATATASVQVDRVSLLALSGSSEGVTIGSPAAPIIGIDITIQSKIESPTETEIGNAAVSLNSSSSASGGTASAAIGGTAVANSSGYALGALVLEITFNFTNQTGFDLDFLTVRTDFSAFNPGGPAIGARVDDIAREFARFASSVSGPGAGDSHQCDTRLPAGPGNTVFPQPPPAAACGVASPDSSQGEFVIADFDQGETVSQTYVLQLTVEAQSIAEPGTVALFGAALLALAAYRPLRRRR
jgi:hypothetical protein